jgi:soluble lytic murein transglycosylase
LRRLSLAASLLALLGCCIAIYALVADPPWFERIRYPLRYSEYVRVHARQNGLDPALLAAVIYSESRFDAGAQSRSGAIGLMQLTPSTAKGIAVRTGGTQFRTDDLLDPEINIRYGAWYLSHLFEKYRSERLVLAAYNAGQGNVDRWRSAGLPIEFPETRAYVARVEHLKRVYDDAWHGALYS